MSSVTMADFGLQNQYEIPNKPYEIGRVLSQEKDLYGLISKSGEQFAKVSGKLRYEAKNVADFPAVGDFVLVDGIDTNDTTVIHRVLPRKSVFIRKAAGTGNREQVVAANIDTVFICMSLNKDFNLRRLERYLSAAWDSGANPVIVLTKSDLCSDVLRQKEQVEQVAFGVDILTTSTKDVDSYQKLLPYIGPGKTASLIGSSGVGKSTLINGLLGENRLATNGLRNDDKGKHTTTRRELFLLPSGGMIIDTPGMRELGLWNAEEGIDKSFDDIESLASMCRFNDCTHTNEPHCAIREAIEKGDLSLERFMSYQKLKAETAYLENTDDYLTVKKQKFKKIAKINKDRRI